jgi:putative transposase
VTAGGWSLRQAAATLGIDQVRLLRWQARAVIDRLDDAKPGSAEALHALLAWERDTMVTLAEDWGEVDRSHHKLAQRASRLDRVYVSESTVLRVLEQAGMRLPGTPTPEKRPARPWPDWGRAGTGVIWIYDFTYFTAAKRCAVPVLDVVSRKWLSTVVSAEESSTQVEVAFTRALCADGMNHLLDGRGRPLGAGR